MPTIVKRHLPTFEGDAPKDWVPGSRFRFKNNHPTLRSSFSKWYKDEHLSITGMEVLWLTSLLYEYEVEDKMTIATYKPKFGGDCPPDYEVGCKTWDIIGGDPIKNYRDPSWHEGASYRYYAKEKQPAVKPEKFWIVWRPVLTDAERAKRCIEDYNYLKDQGWTAHGQKWVGAQVTKGTPSFRLVKFSKTTITEIP